MSGELDIRSESFGLLGIQPKTLDEVLEVCKHIADSDFVPKDFRGKPGNVMIAGQMGHELGLPLMQSLQSIAVINGRPAIYGDALVGIIRARPNICEYINESFQGEGDKLAAVCVAKRRDQDKPSTATFSVGDARRAGLWDKSGPWKQYPKRMLMWRARGFALRDAFPELLKGIITTEEAMDIPIDSAEIVPPRKYKTAPRAIDDPVVIADDLPPSQETPAPTAAPAGNGFPRLPGKDEPISEAQSNRLYALCKSVKTKTEPWEDEQAKAYLLNVWGYSSSKDIRRADYERICKLMEFYGPNDAIPAPLAF
jgi:hypothetical protein